MVAIGLAVAVLGAGGCSPKAPSGSQATAPTASQTAAPAASTGADGTSTVPSEPTPVGGRTDPTTTLKINDLVVGTGPTAQVGQQVWIDYTGWLTDGTKFDSTVGYSPFEFSVGEGVLPGLDKGVAGMKVGGTRVLVIPPSMAYGAKGVAPGVPPNATVKFQVTLLSIEPSNK